MKTFIQKYLLFLSITIIFVLLLLKIFNFPLSGVDDANIFLVYARNLANGEGFVYNIGGEKTEGFTSVLWVLICSLTFFISNHPEVILIIINTIIISFGLTLLTTSFKKDFLLKKFPPVWEISFMVLIYSMPAYITWNTITLMDNGIWSTLLLIITILLVKADTIDIKKINISLSFLLVLLILARPESILWSAVFISLFFILRLKKLSVTEALKSMGIPFLTYICTVSILTIFRFVYFGYPLPNTYYAKVSPSLFYNIFTGMRYLAYYFFSDSIIVKICLLSAVFTFTDTLLIIFKKNIKKINGFNLLPFVVFTGILIPVLVGGDHFGSFRFFQNIYPILLLNLFYFVKFVLPRYISIPRTLNTGRVYQPLFCGVVAFAFLIIQADKYRTFETTSNLSHEFLIAQDGRKCGKYMSSLFSKLPELPDVGVIVAGGIKFDYRGRIVDLMGLNNNQMAHYKGNRHGIKNHAAFEKEIFYKQVPDIVIPALADKREWKHKPCNLENSFENRVLKGLLNDNKFRELYIYTQVKIPDTRNDTLLTGWFKKDYLSYLEKTDAFQIQSYNQ